MIIIKKIFFFLRLIKIKKIFFKKNFFIKNFLFDLNKFFLCLNCHSNNNFLYYPKIFRIPIIKNQNKEYLINSFLSYKLFHKKSFYMNLIANYLKNIKNFLYLF